jgi:hypothetical protein
MAITKIKQVEVITKAVRFVVAINELDALSSEVLISYNSFTGGEEKQVGELTLTAAQIVEVSPNILAVLTEIADKFNPARAVE